jgi:hypothetical protein
MLVVLSATALPFTVYAGSSDATASSAPGRGQERGVQHAVERAMERGVEHVPVPRKGRAVHTGRPDHVIGNGTPAGCTSKKVVQAVAKGGVITFHCGPDPVVIEMRRTAKVMNGHRRADGSIRATRRVVIDGGGLVTLSGMGRRRIL